MDTVPCSAVFYKYCNDVTCWHVYCIEYDLPSQVTADDKNDSNSKQKKRTKVVKDKIPQKLIDNRKEEIILSLNKVQDASRVMIEGIPRVYTGSKRGSNYRGVSVNGKKWQVSNFSWFSIYVPFSARSKSFL